MGKGSDINVTVLLWPSQRGTCDMYSCSMIAHGEDMVKTNVMWMNRDGKRFDMKKTTETNTENWKRKTDKITQMCSLNLTSSLTKAGNKKSTFIKIISTDQNYESIFFICVLLFCSLIKHIYHFNWKLLNNFTFKSHSSFCLFPLTWCYMGENITFCIPERQIWVGLLKGSKHLLTWSLIYFDSVWWKGLKSSTKQKMVNYKCVSKRCQLVRPVALSAWQVLMSDSEHMVKMWMN